MDKPVAKRELIEALEIWGGALEPRLEARFDARLTEQTRVLSGELAQHANRILDAVHEITGALDEKYEDLPARVVRLEQKVFPPRRQRRR